MKTIILLISLLIAPIHLSADVWGNINKLYQWNHVLLVHFDDNNNDNPASCLRSGFYYAFDSGSMNGEFIKAILLAARINQTRVKLVISKTECLYNFPKITAVSG